MKKSKHQYAYRYLDANAEGPLKECPECGGDLTCEGGVVIDCVANGGAWLGQHPSRLDGGGGLLDPEGLVAAGKHSHTLCGHCYEPLINMDGVVEEEVGDEHS